MNDKLKELLASRRLWSALVPCAMAALCFKQGLISADKMVTWLEVAWGIYSGSLGVEHAAKVLQEGKVLVAGEYLSTADTDRPPPPSTEDDS